MEEVEPGEQQRQWPWSWPPSHGSWACNPREPSSRRGSRVHGPGLPAAAAPTARELGSSSRTCDPGSSRCCSTHVSSPPPTHSNSAHEPNSPGCSRGTQLITPSFLLALPQQLPATQATLDMVVTPTIPVFPAVTPAAARHHQPQRHKQWQWGHQETHLTERQWRMESANSQI